jgi:two-component system sensor histidine kinase KdpD
MMSRLDPHRRYPGPRAAIAGVVPAAAVTASALLPLEPSTTTAAVAYVLAVLISAALGGLVAGLGASVLSFLALNYFFTAPRHTFAVGKTEDIVALGAFLAVSVTVGTMLSRVLEQRARAERREREARMLHHLGTWLLSGVPTEEVLERLARSLTDLFGLARCEIRSDLVDRAVVAERPEIGPADVPEIVPITTKDRELGRIVAVPSRAHPSLEADERAVLQTLAAQVGLAIEGVRLGTEAQDARVEAETNRLRAALFSSVTHDLRTPLASITASVSSLLDREAPLDDTDRHELLETIDQEAGRLNRIVGNLLDVARMRSGAVVPSRTPTSFDEVVEGVVGRSDQLLKEHRVRLMVREDVPVVSVDVGLMDQALTNVLENAARFTPPGRRIDVTVARWHDGVQVRVADQGPGVRPDDRERVFEPFVRGDGSTGTGLGLAIARAIVEAHGGTIRIGEAPGGGAAVVIELPGRR